MDELQYCFKITILAKICIKCVIFFFNFSKIAQRLGAVSPDLASGVRFNNVSIISI